MINVVKILRIVKFSINKNRSNLSNLELQPKSSPFLNLLEFYHFRKYQEKKVKEKKSNQIENRKICTPVNSSICFPTFHCMDDRNCYLVLRIHYHRRCFCCEIKKMMHNNKKFVLVIHRRLWYHTRWEGKEIIRLLIRKNIFLSGRYRVFPFPNVWQDANVCWNKLSFIKHFRKFRDI